MARTIYANNAGTSWPKPSEVREETCRALTAEPREMAALFESAREDVCRFLGIEDPERFLFTSGCTAALGVAIGDLPWSAGDGILTSSLEHHALARPVTKLARERGVVHHAAPRASDGPIDLDFARDTLRKGGVRLVAVCAASNVTGEILPVRELVAMAHEHDALVLLDAAQTVGLLPVDVKTLGADIVVFAGHKAPLGPHGIGGLWAAPHVEFESPAASCAIGGGSVPDPCVTFPGYCDVGSVNLAAAAGLAAGVRWIRSRGLELIERHALGLAARLVDGVRDRKGCTVHAADSARRTATVSLTLEALPLERAETFFARRCIVVRTGQHCAPMALHAIGAPQGTLRISFGRFNCEEDVAAIVQAITEAG